jgi:hypothetical protein
MFFVLTATSPGLHDDSCPYQGLSIFPHIVIHHIIREYDDDISMDLHAIVWLSQPDINLDK